MKKIIIVWTIILIIIISGLTFFGLKIKKNVINELMEKELVTQSKNYLEHNTNLYPSLNNYIKIQVGELIEKGYNPKLEKGCTGYIIVKNETSGYEYSSYLKCPDYTTKGYEA